MDKNVYTQKEYVRFIQLMKTEIKSLHLKNTSLEKRLKEKDMKNGYYDDAISELEKKNEDLKKINKEFHRMYLEEQKKPWWKKIF